MRLTPKPSSIPVYTGIELPLNDDYSDWDHSPGLSDYANDDIYSDYANDDIYGDYANEYVCDESILIRLPVKLFFLLWLIQTALMVSRKRPQRDLH